MSARGPGPICVACSRIMRPFEVGAIIEELTETGEPYQLWMGDIWQCPECSRQVVWGYGDGPIAQQWQKTEYDDLKEKAKATRLVSAR